MADLPPGPRRTDHRAYAVPCARTCKAERWRACVGVGVTNRGDPLDQPHRTRVADERAARGGVGTSAKDRTPGLFEEGALPPSFADPTVRVVARDLAAPIDDFGEFRSEAPSADDD